MTNLQQPVFKVQTEHRNRPIYELFDMFKEQYYATSDWMKLLFLKIFLPWYQKPKYKGCIIYLQEVVPRSLACPDIVKLCSSCEYVPFSNVLVLMNVACSIGKIHFPPSRQKILFVTELRHPIYREEVWYMYGKCWGTVL